MRAPRLLSIRLAAGLGLVAVLPMLAPLSCTGPAGATPDGPDAAAPVDAAPAEAASPPKPRDAGKTSGPKLLSETGLYADLASRTLAPGVLAYSVRYALWSDDSEKARYVLLPEGTKIDTRELDEWAFPVGTKAWKEFRVGGKLVETRVLWKQKAEEGADAWWMASYVWRADGSDAEVALDGVQNALGTTHDVPSQLDCEKCHTDSRDALIGVSAIQLSKPAGDSFLAKLKAESRLSHPPATEPSPPGTGVVEDALGYLHGNCGHCHNERALRLATQSDMRLRLRVSEQTPEATQIYKTTINVKMKHVFPPDIELAVAPGLPEKSELWVRVNLRDLNAMPPVGTKKVDPVGSALLREWITGLK